MKRIEIFTDGACLGNPGPGGYGVILRYRSTDKELSRGFRRTTNNRMELLAAIAGLEAVKESCTVELYSDSKYVVNGIAKGWALKWRSRGWLRERSQLAANWDLWDRLLVLTRRHSVQFSWVKGHAGHVENERCDQLAVAAANGPGLDVDAGYEDPPSP